MYNDLTTFLDCQITYMFLVIKKYYLNVIEENKLQIT